MLVSFSEERFRGALRNQPSRAVTRSEEHTSELQSQPNLVCRLLLEKKKLQTFSVYGVWTIMFVETCLLVGFFFPGDSLLLLAGIASSPSAMAIGVVQLALAMLLIGS